MDEHNSPRRRRSPSAKARRRRRRKIKLLIRRIVFCAVLAALIFSIVMIVRTFTGNTSEKIYTKVEKSVFVSAENNSKDTELLTGYNHNSLLAINPDAIGYLQIPALELLLPVVQGEDNSYYLSHAVTGDSNKNGTLFIDCRNTDGIESQNAIIYGHNMKDGSMFGQLKKFIDSEFLFKDDNQYFYIYTQNKIYKYAIYSVHITQSVSNAYTNTFNSGTEFVNFINTMLSLSYHDTNVSFDETSKSITFSTSTDDSDKRLIVQAIRVEEITQ